jgi:hypothetical protein
MPSPINMQAVRRHLEADGVRLAREPSEFNFHALISLDEMKLGWRRFARRLQRLRHVANDLTDGRYALLVVRDPQTRERTGYAVYADSQAVCDLIARRMW